MKLFCGHCLKPFESKAPNRIFCTSACAKASRREEVEYQRTRQASYRNAGRPNVSGHCFDLGLQDER